MGRVKFYPVKGYIDLQKQATSNIGSFWAKEASKLPWFKQWDEVLRWEEPFAKWFVGGMLNASYLCVDTHLYSWHKNKVALYWEDEAGNTKAYSYLQLYQEVNRFASMLKNLGVEKGDRVVLYLPMIPELPIAMLATARIGAIHTVVFSGFSSQALADRINDTSAEVLITADFGLRRGKYIPLKEIVDEALKATPTVKKVVVIKRAKEEVVQMEDGRDFFYHEFIKDAFEYVDPVPLESTHPLYILYTSGTTGKPKGVVHSTGGYLVYNYATYKWVFNISDESIYWCTADVGWVTGHSSIVYAPLLHGATVLMYEGAPDYPDPGVWWRIIEKYGVTIFYTSPTAIRMFMRYGEEWVTNDLSSLKILGSVGEPINPEVWEWYYKHIGGEKCPIVDTWWQTETGGIMISPAPGLELIPLKPGSATLPLPGIDAEVVDEEGKPVGAGIKGYLVIRKPWPGILMGLYRDPERYKEVYWSRFKGMYYTGDYAMKDEEGYFWLFGRADEVIKVAGHRLGTAEIESSVVSAPFVAEAAVISKPDPIKGETIVVFAILKAGYKPEDNLKKDIIKQVREQIGPIATPDEVHFVAKLPKTRSGKIMRRLLKAVVLDKPTGDITTLEDEASIEEVKTVYEEFKQMVKE